MLKSLFVTMFVAASFQVQAASMTDGAIISSAGSSAAALAPSAGLSVSSAGYKQNVAPVLADDIDAAEAGLGVSASLQAYINQQIEAGADADVDAIIADLASYL